MSGVWQKRQPGAIKVYHLFAGSKNGLMVQILSGLITYLLLAIYCHEQHGEQVSIRRVRQLRNQIRNEAREQAGKEAVLRTISQRKRKRIKNHLQFFNRTLLDF